VQSTRRPVVLEDMLQVVWVHKGHVSDDVPMQEPVQVVALVDLPLHGGCFAPVVAPDLPAHCVNEPEDALYVLVPGCVRVVWE
jgi:hypothetical protein